MCLQTDKVTLPIVQLLIQDVQNAIGDRSGEAGGDSSSAEEVRPSCCICTVKFQRLFVKAMFLGQNFKNLGVTG